MDIINNQSKVFLPVNDILTNIHEKQYSEESSKLESNEYKISLTSHSDILDSHKMETLINKVSKGDYRIVDTINLYSSDYLPELNKAYFNLFKNILTKTNKIQYYLFFKQENYYAGLLEGLGLSLQKESLNLKFKSIVVEDTDILNVNNHLLNNLDICESSIFSLKRNNLYKLSLQRSKQDRSVQIERQHVIDTFSNKTFLITGNGKISRILARYLKQNHNSKIIMWGRNTISKKDMNLLKDCGIDLFIKVDPYNTENLRNAWIYSQNSFEQIRGIFHLAGFINDKLFINKKYEEFNEVLSPKIQYTLNLDQVVKHSDLDFIAYFSSLSGIIGNIGQTDYASGNAFLRYWTKYKNQLTNIEGGSKRYFCIDWGLWQNGGMKINLSNNEIMPMDDEDACKQLESIISNNHFHSVVYKGKDSLISPLIKTLPTQNKIGLNKKVFKTDENIHDGLDTKELINRINKWTKTKVIKYTNFTNLEDDQSVVSLGADSISVINIITDMEKELKGINPRVVISKILIFDYPSVNLLSDYLFKNFKNEFIKLVSGNLSLSSPLFYDKIEDKTTKELQTLKLIHGEINNSEEKYKDHNDNSNSHNTINLNKNDTSEVSQDIYIKPGPVPPMCHNPVSTEYSEIKHTSSDRLITPKLNNQSNDYNYNNDKIAIIGLAGRFPNSQNIDEFWNNIINGKNCIDIIPKDRWDWERDYDSDKSNSLGTYSRHGGFLKSIKHFDPLFFEISPSQAEKMDPQCKLLLENVYHALEDSFILNDNNLQDCGVFTASMFGHYILHQQNKQVIDYSAASLSNRISYHYNMKGPSISIDTMCSGSLTTLHLACNSLKNKECNTAIVNGVNLMPNPSKYRFLSQGRFLSPSGKCSSFGINADGYVPGEGIVTVVLKKCSNAIKDGNYIYGTILGSAINSDGKSSAFTAPNSKAQTEVILKAFKDANIDPSTIDYIEAHGTGTKLGDPIEIKGLNNAWKKLNNLFKNKCPVGSVKSNVGHLESAAGLVGLIKILMQFKYKKIAPSINCNIENPLLNLEDTAFYIPRKAQSFDQRDTPLRSCISSFGAGGSNSHFILEEYKNIKNDNFTSPFYLFVISAKSVSSLKILLTKYQNWLDKVNEDISYSLACTCSRTKFHFNYRVAIIYKDINDLTGQIEDIITNSNFSQYKIERSFQVEDISTSKDFYDSYQYYEYLQKLYREGAAINWDKVYSHQSFIKVPSYAFENNISWSRDFDESINSESSKHLSENNGSQENLTSYNLGHNVIKNIELDNLHHFVPIWINNNKKNLGYSNSKDQICIISTGQAWSLQTYILDNFSNITSSNLISYFRKNTQLNTFIFDFRLIEDLLEYDSYIKFIYDILEFFSDNRKRLKIAFVHDNKINLRNTYVKSLVGLLKSLAIEHPSLYFKCICFEQNTQTNYIENKVLNELNYFNSNFEKIKFEGNNRLKELYVNKSIKNDFITKFRHNGTYLITGGLGKIGQIISKYLVKNYQANLILLGSSDLDEERKRFLEQPGFKNKIIYKRVDVTQRLQLKSLISELNKNHTINGIIHSAGRIDDKLFTSKKYEDFKKIFSIKEKGLYNIDEVTKDLKLDFKLLFSSIASVYGNAGQTDYAFGNSYMDNYAEYRNNLRNENLRYGKTLSFNWPLWENGGMEIDSDQKKFMFDSLGIKPLDDLSAIYFIEYLLSSNENIHQSLVLKGDYNRITENDEIYYKKGEYIDSDYNSEKESKEVSEGVCNSIVVLPTILSQNKGIDRPKFPLSSEVKDIINETNIYNELKKIVSTITDIPILKLEKNVSFGEYGFTSVSLERFSKDIKNLFEVNISPNMFFNLNNIEKLSDYISRKIDLASLTDHRNIQVNTKESKYSNTYPLQTEDPKYSIIGISGMLPSASNLNLFWKNMIENNNVIEPIKRWRDRNYRGGVISNISDFDASFFNISGKEAMLMDPQHRLFLEVGYNTFLDAGYNPRKLKKVGVFAGVQFNDYQFLLQKNNISSHPYAATGNAHTMLANRLSYIFDFKGPSQTIDTACSSSLVAIKRAILALENRDCEYALVGGVSLMIDPMVTDAARSMGVLSPDYRCATFDQEANGYVRGEGIGAVLLKREQDAIEHKDHIYANILQAEENHGGKAHSLTAPNPDSQTELLMKAYDKNDFWKDITYIETHGTGTKLGDPIEVDALKLAWNKISNNSSHNKIGLGSVKTHIGHLEPAAGIASLLKVVLCIKNRILPKNLHFKGLNKYIELRDSPFYVVNGNQEWQSSSLLTAGISSFGFGGSNAHIVIQEPSKEKIFAQDLENKYYPVCISAKSEWSFEQTRKMLLESIIINRDNPYFNLQNISFTLNVGRQHFQYRMIFLCSSLNELIEALSHNSSYPQKADSIKEFSEDLSKYHIETDFNKLAKIFLDGYNINWETLYNNNYKRVNLPGYVFDKKNYWFEDLGSRNRGLLHMSSQ